MLIIHLKRQPMDRSAIDTIRGYCYQFDKSILTLLSLKNDIDKIEVEGIEDVDVNEANELTAIQCKYYEKTSYNHSVIAKPIRLMLKHFSQHRNLIGKYHLYGHYKDGQDKLPKSIDITFLKENFLTYTKSKVQYKSHEDLNLSDSDLQKFLEKLSIDINAVSYEEQKNQVIEKLEIQFSCSEEEAIHYYYNAAFSAIIDLGCSHSNRTISKSKFIDKLSGKEILFNTWIYKLNGRKAYLSKVKNDLFTRELNTQPFDRFFIVDVSSSKGDSDIKDCIYSIQKKWSNLSKRSPTPYSPYIFLYGKNEELLHLIKHQLYNEGLVFSDGYNFFGSKFCSDSILSAKSNKDISFQYIESENDLLSTIKSSKSKVEIFHFYNIDKNIQDKIDSHIKYVKLQILEFNDIKDII